jgi:hypothetical protein
VAVRGGGLPNKGAPAATAAANAGIPAADDKCPWLPRGCIEESSDGCPDFAVDLGAACLVSDENAASLREVATELK